MTSMLRVKPSCLVGILVLQTALFGCGSTTPPPPPPPPPPAVTSVTITPASAVVATGQDVQFTASVVADDGAATSVVWTTSDATIATVDGTGRARGIAVGTTSLLATSTYNHLKQGTAILAVTAAPVVTTRITPPAASLTVGQTQQLIATTLDAGGNALTGRPVTWLSTAPGTVSVSATGLVYGISVGIATITATSEGKAGTAQVTVSDPVAAVTVLASTINIGVGNSLPLSVTTVGVSGYQVTGRTVAWSSSAPTIASVSSAGVVTGIAPGTTTITATSEGKSGSTVICVSDPAHPTLQVAAVAADDGPLDGLRIVISWSGGADTLNLPLTGVGTRAFTRAPGGTTVDITLDASNPTSRRYFPLVRRGVRADTSLNIRAVLSPLVWRIARGTFAGATVPVSVDLAFPMLTDLVQRDNAFYRSTGIGNFKSNLGGYSVTDRWKLRTVYAWKEENFPIPVYFDRFPDDFMANFKWSIATAADSVNLWRALDAMNAAFGDPIFRPAQQMDFQNFRDPNAWNAIDVATATPGSFGLGGAGSAEGISCRQSDELCDLSAGSVLFGSRTIDGVTYGLNTSDVLTIQHEFLHALGFNHGCNWPTILKNATGPAQNCTDLSARSISITVGDVAYAQLYFAVARHIRSIGANWSLYESIAGEREILKGLPSWVSGAFLMNAPPAGNNNMMWDTVHRIYVFP